VAPQALQQGQGTGRCSVDGAVHAQKSGFSNLKQGYLS